MGRRLWLGRAQFLQLEACECGSGISVHPVYGAVFGQSANSSELVVRRSGFGHYGAEHAAYEPMAERFELRPRPLVRSKGVSMVRLPVSGSVRHRGWHGVLPLRDRLQRQLTNTNAR